ncbi:MAG TPA: hypothetical protein VJH70_03240 [Candidatus Paceibacterota bacterium]
MFSKHPHISGSKSYPFAFISGLFAGPFSAEMVLGHLAAHDFAVFSDPHSFAVTFLHT